MFIPSEGSSRVGRFVRGVYLGVKGGGGGSSRVRGGYEGLS